MVSHSWQRKEKHAPNVKAITLSPLIDRVGIFFGSVCLVHCWIFPFLLAIFPAMPFMDEWIHPVLAAIAVITSVLLIMRSKQIRRNPFLIVLLLAGNICLVLACWYATEWFSLRAEILLNTAGSIALVTVHYKSLHRHKRKQQASCF